MNVMKKIIIESLLIFLIGIESGFIVGHWPKHQDMGAKNDCIHINTIVGNYKKTITIYSPLCVDFK